MADVLVDGDGRLGGEVDLLACVYTGGWGRGGEGGGQCWCSDTPKPGNDLKIFGHRQCQQERQIALERWEFPSRYQLIVEFVRPHFQQIEGTCEIRALRLDGPDGSS